MATPAEWCPGRTRSAQPWLPPPGLPSTRSGPRSVSTSQRIWKYWHHATPSWVRSCCRIHRRHLLFSKLAVIQLTCNGNIDINYSPLGLALSLDLSAGTDRSAIMRCLASKARMRYLGQELLPDPPPPSPIFKTEIGRAHV